MTSILACIFCCPTPTTADSDVWWKQFCWEEIEDYAQSPMRTHCILHGTYLSAVPLRPCGGLLGRVWDNGSLVRVKP